MRAQKSAATQLGGAQAPLSDARIGGRGNGWGPTPSHVRFVVEGGLTVW